jgi:hypothetical protein
MINSQLDCAAKNSTIGEDEMDFVAKICMLEEEVNKLKEENASFNNLIKNEDNKVAFTIVENINLKKELKEARELLKRYELKYENLKESMAEIMLEANKLDSSYLAREKENVEMMLKHKRYRVYDENLDSSKGSKK